jgi:hypothetical protein
VPAVLGIEALRSSVLNEVSFGVMTDKTRSEHERSAFGCIATRPTTRIRPTRVNTAVAAR